jgi:TRAP-type C4-dicarboxylate transport system permease small subunit
VNHAAEAGRSAYAMLDRGLGMVEAACASIAACTMLFAMVLVSIDAVARYGFNAPLTFAYYLTENYLLVAIVTMSMAWGFRTGGYIRIMALAQRLRPGARQLLLRAGLLLSSSYIGALAVTGGEYFLEAYQKNETHLGTIDWPVPWSWVWIPLGCGLLALRLLLTAFGPAAALHLEHDPVEDAV